MYAVYKRRNGTLGYSYDNIIKWITSEILFTGSERDCIDFIKNYTQ